jgi:hypothetical protein
MTNWIYERATNQVWLLRSNEKFEIVVFVEEIST